VNLRKVEHKYTPPKENPPPKFGVQFKSPSDNNGTLDFLKDLGMDSPVPKPEASLKLTDKSIDKSLSENTSEKTHDQDISKSSTSPSLYVRAPLGPPRSPITLKVPTNPRTHNHIDSTAVMTSTEVKSPEPISNKPQSIKNVLPPPPMVPSVITGLSPPSSGPLPYLSSEIKSPISTAKSPEIQSPIITAKSPEIQSPSVTIKSPEILSPSVMTKSPEIHSPGVQSPPSITAKSSPDIEISPLTSPITSPHMSDDLILTTSKMNRPKQNRSRSLSSAEKKIIKKTKTVDSNSFQKKKKGFSISFNRSPKSKKNKKKSDRFTNLDDIVVGPPQFLGKNISSELASLPRTDQTQSSTRIPDIVKSPQSPPSGTILSSPPPEPEMIHSPPPPPGGDSEEGQNGTDRVEF